MRTESDKQNLKVFLAVLLVTAFAINGIVSSLVSGIMVRVLEHSNRNSTETYHTPVYSPSASVPSTERHTQQEQVQQERLAEAALMAQAAADRQEEKRRAAELAAEEHARYLARYIRSGFTRKPGANAIALVAASENKRSNQALSDALSHHLQAQSVTLLPSFFRAEFVTDGLFNEAFNEPSELPAKLELRNVLDGILIARQTVDYSTNPGLQNSITATMRLEVLALPISNDAQRQTWSFTAYGAGFIPADARAMAEERIIKQITEDTKMSLAPFRPSNPNQ